MRRDLKSLRAALQRTASRCHLCRSRVYLKNYGAVGARGSWELDHVTPRARGGSDHGNNILAACIPCNRSKQARATATIRAANGLAQRPMSERQRAKAKAQNGIAGALLAGAAGLAFFNPLVAGGLAFLGAIIGHEADPE